MGVAFCPRCGASLSPRSRFCGHCGEASRAFARRATQQRRLADRDTRRRGQAITLVFVGALTAVVIPAVAFPEATLAAVLVAFALELGVAAAVQGWLGWRTWRHASGRRPDLHALASSVPAAALTLAVSWGYVEILVALAPRGSESEFEPSRSWVWALAAVALAPCAEELLCRGALWAAVRPVTNRWTAILVTALVFGFLHGLNGGHVLEVPHRFFMGCVLGWLRARTGSLAPCIAAHALHNLVAVTVWW